MKNFNFNKLREIFIFIIVGLTAVLIDYIIYILLNGISIDILFSKSLSYISGTIFAYFANKLFTFNDNKGHSKTFPKFIMLYTITLIINTLSNNYSVMMLENYVNYFIEISFLISTLISATLNFLGMKFFIFNSIKL